MHDPIYNAYWVRPERLMAGSHPAGNNETQTRDNVNLLREAGITFFVDLTEAGEDISYAPFIGPDAQYRHFPIVDMQTPDAPFMQRILDSIDTAIDAGQTVYVHCFAGIGRTGTVIGCWLVRHGLAGEAALDEIERLREGQIDSPQTNAQRNMILGWRG